METYTPQHSPRYHENEAKLRGDEWPCFICGKAVRRDGWWARTIYGSDICTDAYADARPDGDTGGYPIGPECYRKLPAEVKKWLVKDEEEKLDS